MTSNINYIGIDENFPVAGVDNSTQGFRDNFNVIKDSFNSAKSEIESLQSNTAKTNVDSDFNGNTIIDANLRGVTDEVFSTETGVNINVNISNGAYQIITVTAGVNLEFTGWPDAGRCGKVCVELRGDGTSRTVTFSSVGGADFLKEAGFPTTVTITSETEPKIFEFWTWDGGGTILGRYLGEFTA